MPKQQLSHELNKARQALYDHVVPAPTRAEVEEAIAELEIKLAQQEPVHPEDWVNLLQQQEARLEVEHPVIAGIFTNMIHILSAMGV